LNFFEVRARDQEEVAAQEMLVALLVLLKRVEAVLQVLLRVLMLDLVFQALLLVALVKAADI
jgi:hypothetical protein